MAKPSARRLGHCFLCLASVFALSCIAESVDVTDDSSMSQDEACVVLQVPDLDKACKASPEWLDGPEGLVWAALTNITRDCKLDPSHSEVNQTSSSDSPNSSSPGQSAYDAYGLFWATPTAQYLDDFLKQMQAVIGLRVGAKARALQDFIGNWLEVWPNATHPGPNDFWLVGGEAFGEVLLADSPFLDLTGALRDDDSYRLADIPPSFRDAGSSAYAGTYSSLPLWLTPYQLLYRRDIFQANGIVVPHTWDEVIDVAERYGRGQLGPGQPELGFCFEANLGCANAHAVLMYILSTIVQLNGPSHGTWFDPYDMQPLYTQPAAMAEALRIYRTLKNHSVPDDTPCFQVYDMLASGKCLMLWSYSSAFKRASHNSSAIPGCQGVTLTPGSTRVLDRSTGRLVPCTQTLCPYAISAAEDGDGDDDEVDGGGTLVTNSTTSRISSSTADGTAAPPSSPSPPSPPQSTSQSEVPRSQLLVNHVVPLDTVSFVINAYAPLERQAAAFIALHTFTGPDEHTRIMLKPDSELTPLRYHELDEALWVANGYDADDVRGFLHIYQGDFSRANVNYKLRIPGVFQLYVMMTEFVQRALYDNDTLDELLSYAARRTEEIISSAGGRDVILPLYRKSLDYTPPSPPPRPSSVGGSRDALTHTLLEAILPTAVCLVAAAAVLWAVLRWRRRRQERRARMHLAPGVGPGTTLLVTDIQDSTSLWEALRAEVMDAAVREHHRVIRELLLRHRGYESATEGDSFILAFHKPDRALGFALAAQDALLRTADWPPELCDTRYAAALVVRRDAAVAARLAPSLTGGLKEMLAPSPGPGAGTVAHRPGLVSGSPLGWAGRGTAASLPTPALHIPAPLVPPQPRSRPASLDLPSTLRRPLPSLTEGSAATARRMEGTVAAERTSPLPSSLIATSRSCRDAVPAPGSPSSVLAALTLAPASGEGTAAAAIELSTTPPSLRSSQLISLADLAPVSEGGRPSFVPKRLRMLANWRGFDWQSASRNGEGDGRGTAAIPQLLHTAEDIMMAERRTLSCRGTANRLLPSQQQAAPTPGDDAASSFGIDDTTTDAQAGGDGFGGAETAWTLQDVLRRVFPAVDGDDEEPPPASAAAAALGAMAVTAPAAAAAAAGSGGGSILLFRGLRVRMGMHCGLYGAAEVSYNRASGRMAYSGPTLQLAKAVSDAGRGGHITLSSRTLIRLVQGGMSHVNVPYVVLAGGRHVLKGANSDAATCGVEVYTVFARGLVARAGHLERLRTEEVKMPGVLDAPLGRVAVALAVVQDPDGFAGWGLEVSLDAHKALMGHGGRLASRHGGYLLATPPGSLQAIFTRPAAAVIWLLHLRDELGSRDPASIETHSRQQQAQQQEQQQEQQLQFQGEQQQQLQQQQALRGMDLTFRIIAAAAQGAASGPESLPGAGAMAGAAAGPAGTAMAGPGAEAACEFAAGTVNVAGSGGCSTIMITSATAAAMGLRTATEHIAATTAGAGSRAVRLATATAQAVEVVSTAAAAAAATGGAGADATTGHTTSGGACGGGGGGGVTSGSTWLSPSSLLEASHSVSTTETPHEARMLQRAAAAAQFSLFRVKGGVDVGSATAALRDGGAMSYSGGSVKRASCLAANAAWREVLVSVEVVRAVAGEGHPALRAPHSLKHRQRRGSRVLVGTAAVSPTHAAVTSTAAISITTMSTTTGAGTTGLLRPLLDPAPSSRLAVSDCARGAITSQLAGTSGTRVSHLQPQPQSQPQLVLSRSLPQSHQSLLLQPTRPLHRHLHQRPRLPQQQPVLSVSAAPAPFPGSCQSGGGGGEEGALLDDGGGDIAVAAAAAAAAMDDVAVQHEPSSLPRAPAALNESEGSVSMSCVPGAAQAAAATKAKPRGLLPTERGQQSAPVSLGDDMPLQPGQSGSLVDDAALQPQASLPISFGEDASSSLMPQQSEPVSFFEDTRPASEQQERRPGPQLWTCAAPPPQRGRRPLSHLGYHTRAGSLTEQPQPVHPASQPQADVQPSPQSQTQPQPSPPQQRQPPAEAPARPIDNIWFFPEVREVRYKGGTIAACVARLVDTE